MSTHFQQQLQSASGKQLKLKINDNHSTMLSVKWEPDCTKVSVHKMFLDAPQNVMEALACYIHNGEGAMAPIVKSFIEDGLQNLDYSNRIDSHKLNPYGKVYDLKEIYDTLNKEYFDEALKLKITWFDRNIKDKKKISFGLYCDLLKLIKIHRQLDNAKFPKYVVAYIVYHEMLHNTCPTYVDTKGVRQIHNRKFKTQEVQFKEFHRAQNWIKQHCALFFQDEH